jgi:hypothetical protein
MIVMGNGAISITKNASVEMMRMSATEESTSKNAGAQSPEMLALANRVRCGLAAKHNAHDRERSERINAEVRLEFSDR